MDIGERLIESLKINTVFHIKAGALDIPVSETVVLSWVVMALLIILALVFTRNLKFKPGGTQALLETGIEFLNNFSKEQFGKYSRVFGPYIGTLFLFLFFANIIPAFTPILLLGKELPFEVKPPARDINVGGGLALVTILLVLFSGVIVRKPGGWLKTLLHPVPAMLPFNILEYIIKPVTLCLRLFGNILGGFIIMTLVNLALENALGSNAFISVAASLYFDFFDGFIQALVFTFLTTLYIAEAVKLNDE
ncbi:MAG: F0F1 ATP synthase subunit A [Spirochaetaceae bacterium]|nr:F0F1 ATP synthase subunit A [Spirochaetaceae bacterium]